MPKYDVITVGSATVDVFAQTDSKLIKIIGQDTETDLLAFSSGTKLLINKLHFTTGGGGTNSAVSLSRLGLKTAFLGKVGNDENARKVLEALKKDKVDTSLVKHGKGHTGYSIILDSIDKDRVILACKGINDNLSFSEINKNNLKTRWFYFSSMVGESYKTLEKVSSFARKNNIGVLFNPSSYLAEKGLKFLNKVLKNTRILVFNMEEAKTLTKDEDIDGIFKTLFRHGPSIVVITDGKKGVYASDKKHIYKVYPRKTRLVESTGAGDAFASAFLAGMIKKNNMEFALSLGAANAESVIMHHGAKNKLLSYKDALKIMKGFKRKITKTRL